MTALTTAQNVDIQVRFKWTPRTSAIWDNR